MVAAQVGVGKYAPRVCELRLDHHGAISCHMGVNDLRAMGCTVGENRQLHVMVDGWQCRSVRLDKCALSQGSFPPPPPPPLFSCGLPPAQISQLPLKPQIMSLRLPLRNAS